MNNHTISTTCAKCRKPLALDFGDVDGEMADVLREIAKRVVCDQCASQRHAPPARPTNPPTREAVRSPMADP